MPKIAELCKMIETELQGPQPERFRNKSGRFDPAQEEMRTAFGKCIVNIAAIPVVGGEDEVWLTREPLFVRP